MKKYIVATVAVVALIGAYVLFTNKSAPKNTTGTPQTVTPSPVASNEAEVNEIVNTLRVGGSSYADPQGVFSLLYPADYAQDVQGDGQYIRLSKRGKTQKGQTEMYDGVIVVFESVNLNGQPFEAWVDERIKTSTEDGTVEVIEPKKSITVNNYNGYVYTVRGLGESQYTVIQKDPNSSYALSITSAAFDPENVGYQNEIDAIFSTIALLK